MKTIATDVHDSPERLQQMIAMQQQKPGFAVDRYFYRSHVAFEQELDRLIFRSWLYAGHISEIPENGDYLLFEVGEDSIIICRDQSGEVRALHNICRHRGARVCEEQTGNRKTFVCPYHGWVFNTDGSLRAARDMDQLPGFDPADYGLKPVRLNVFMGLIFVNCDPDAADFLPVLEHIRAPLGAYDLDNAKVARKQTYTVDANWKLCLENYLECYHCASSHREYARSHTLRDLSDRVAPLNAAMHARSEAVTGVKGISDEFYALYLDAEIFGGCVSHQRYALYEGYQTGSRDGKPVAPLMGHMQGFDGGAGDYQMGPVSFMLNYPDHCVLYRFIPRGITRTDMQLVWFVNGDAREGVDYDIDRLSWLWDHTTGEDEYIILRNSEGVNSRFFEPGPYQPEFEEVSIAFVAWYLEGLKNAPAVKA
jgi:Rieske 2Fe-2S family protein